MKIKKVFAREVLDSRGNPTIEAEIETENSEIARAIAPSGASIGKYEAYELRDNEKRFMGKGVLNAVDNINQIIAPAIVGQSVFEQKKIDAKMIVLDGTPNKSNLGANAIVSVSMACIRAAACAKKQQLYQYLGGNLLPVPMFNVLNGGKHAGNSLAIQEFLIIPKWPNNFCDALQMAVEVYHTLGKRLVKKYGASAKNVGDEGGFSPNLQSCFDAMEEITLAIEEAGYSKEIRLGCDAAASSFYHQKADLRVDLKADSKIDLKTGFYLIDGKKFYTEELLDYYSEMIEKYKIISIEDPFHEEDFNSFASMMDKFGSRMQIVGDDLLVTNPKRLEIAIRKKAVNALLLKVNQIGTVSESIDVAEMCKKNGIKIIVSHRSGESEDNFIADFAVGLNAGQIKTGAPARSERTSKYNQLLRIEENCAVTMARVF
ncbi:MAG: phosphopyruvate hydratase [Candidatus Micrarchaeota archaeon]